MMNGSKDILIVLNHKIKFTESSNSSEKKKYNYQKVMHFAHLIYFLLQNFWLSYSVKYQKILH